MEVLIAPDAFAGTLDAPQACAAIARGWLAAAPADTVTSLPLSDGGPGFVAVLHAALGGTELAVLTTDPLGRPIVANLLVVGTTAYLESAQACGLHLLDVSERNPTRTTTAGVAALLRAALDSGARRIVVGLGGSATNDGGRGLLEALDLGDVERLRQIELIAAMDVDNPLLGPTGASAVFAPQKGATPQQVQELESRMVSWVKSLGEPSLASRPGAGAAGGLGFGLYLLGARHRPGIQVVLEATSAAELIAQADVVVTGEGAFDFSSLRGKVVAGVAQACQDVGKPCVVIAGQVLVGRREAGAAGVTEAWSVAETVGSVAGALAHPGEGLERAASEVARRWSRS
jgi:glycerate kinase